VFSAKVAAYACDTIQGGCVSPAIVRPSEFRLKYVQGFWGEQVPRDGLVGASLGQELELKEVCGDYGVDREQSLNAFTSRQLAAFNAVESPTA